MGTHALSNNISPQTLCQQSFVAICHCQTSCNCALPLIAATVRSDCTVHLASVKGLESSTHKPILPTQSANMSKEYTYADVSSHSGKKDLLMVIHDKVYNASSFVDEHPGGEEVLLDVGGQDATEAFEDVGHSDEAREILTGLLVGDLKRVPGDPAPKIGATDKIAAGPGGRDAGTGMGVAMYVVLLVGAAAAYFGYTYMQSQDSK